MRTSVLLDPVLSNSGTPSSLHVLKPPWLIRRGPRKGGLPVLYLPHLSQATFHYTACHQCVARRLYLPLLTINPGVPRSQTKPNLVL